MGIFTDNPVLRREIRSRLRLRRLGGSKPLVWGAGVGVLIIVYFYMRGLIAIGRGQAQDARDLWSYLVVFLLLLVVVIAPALLSTAITMEREQQTWEGLASTNLTASEVLLGKWLARLSLTSLPLLVLLPFLIGCAAKGGVGVMTNVVTLLFLLLTTGLFGVLGLFCSFFARKTVTATVVALSVSLFLCLGTPLLAAVAGEYLRAASPDYTYHDPPVLWVNPFYALFALVTVMEPRGVGMIMPSPTVLAGTAGSVYVIAALLTVAAGLFLMTARYRQASRE